MEETGNNPLLATVRQRIIRGSDITEIAEFVREHNEKKENGNKYLRPDGTDSDFLREPRSEMYVLLMLV